jgi:3,4-dihydroxy-2-butanone 4-phosphate synthase
MLDDETGLALTRQDAERYAETHGLVFVDGASVMEWWKKRQSPALALDSL